jgi:hypothetical protein
MGLRGLAYPCSIAQLIAILLMALIRALIRRRLGHLPAYCGAFTNFEMDSFATCLAYSPNFRLYRKISQFEPSLSLEKNKREVLRWKVRTANDANDANDAKNLQFHFKKPQDIVKNHRTKIDPKIDESDKPTPEKADELQQAKGRRTQRFEDKTPPACCQASCRQLIRVRESIGNICSETCDWQSPASEAALSLASAIEAFMKTFFPNTVSEGTAI